MSESQFQNNPDALRLPLPQLAEISFSQGISVLTDPALMQACGVRIAFTQRGGGCSQGAYASLNLATHVGDDAAHVQRNRELLLDALGFGDCAMRLIVPNQVHGTRVLAVHGPDDANVREQAAAGADAIVCTAGATPVLLNFADCVPVICVAPTGAFAVIHSGWRGAIERVAGLGLHALAREAGCAAEECNCYIGPHIGVCCYEVDESLAQRFTGEFGPACVESGRLSLSYAVRAALLDAHAAPERVLDSALCTACNTDKYYSYRASGGTCGRHGAFAGRR